MYKRVLVYNRILVALDGSEQSQRALDHAVAIAEKFGAELTMLAVVPRATIPAFAEEGFEEEPTAETEEMAHFRERMWDIYRSVLTEAEYRVRSEHPDLKMVKVLREGRPSATIVEVAKSDGVDLIVVGSRGIGGIKGWMLGSTSRRVVDSCTKPVLVVK